MVTVTTGVFGVAPIAKSGRKLDEIEYRLSAIMGYVTVVGCGLGLATLLF